MRIIAGMVPAEDQGSADLLKRWMSELGYSGGRLARVMGVTPETVSRWRSGRLEVPRYVLVHLDSMLVVRRIQAECEKLLGCDFPEG